MIEFADMKYVKISIRDERGQAVIEYILVLVVAIAIIFGGLYQLNSAFKSWATNYFGDYLSCLLETGELPSIGGTGGDGNVCNTLFKPFTFAEGRRLAAVAPTKGGEGGGGASGNPSGASERDSGRVRSAGGGGGGGSNGTPFTAGKNFGKGNGGTNVAAQKIENTNPEGKSQISNYGPIGGTNRGGSRSSPSRIKLDQRLLTDDARERNTSQASALSRAPTEAGQAKPPLKVRYSQIKAAGADAGDTGLTIADFIRFLIIAGIVIALVLFLGGQLLQIGKSMD